MSATRPATAGCPHEELIGGGGLSRRVSGGRTLAERAASLTAAMSGTPWRVLEVPTGRSRVRRRPTSDSGAEACLCHRSGRRTSVEAGGSVGIGKQLPPSALAGRGSARRRVVPGGADRLAAGESLGMSCSGSACIKNSKDTSRQRTRTKVVVYLSGPTDLCSPISYLLLRHFLGLVCPIIYPTYVNSSRAILTVISVVLHICICDAQLPPWWRRKGWAGWRCR